MNHPVRAQLSFYFPVETFSLFIYRGRFYSFDPGPCLQKPFHNFQAFLQMSCHSVEQGEAQIGMSKDPTW